MKTIAVQYIEKLTDHLTAEQTNDPAPGIAGGLFHVGRYQDDPTEYTFIATTHEGGPHTVTKTGRQTWRHEEDSKKDREMIGGEYGLSYWSYRYTINVAFYMVDSGEDQEEAREKGMTIAQWIRYKVTHATPSVLGLVPSDFDEVALEQRPTAIEMIESGGPGSYIERILIFIEQSVMVS